MNQFDLTQSSDAADQPDIPLGPQGKKIRFPMALFLFSLGLLFVGVPILDQIQGGQVAKYCLMMPVCLMAILTMRTRRKIMVVAILLGLLAIAGQWYNWLHPSSVAVLISTIFSFSFTILVVWQLLRFIMVSRQVNSEVICAGIAGYLFLVIIWALTYTITAQLHPDAFAYTGPATGPAATMQGTSSLYFSCITISTVGYGDFAPVSGTARVLASLEAITGTFYITILIARLMGMYSSRK